MNKEIINSIVDSAKPFRGTSLELSKHVVNTLPALLEVDNHPTAEEEELGKGDCTTAFKYFEGSVRLVNPNLEISAQIVERSIWEPDDKRANIHMVASCSDSETAFVVDPTHFMGPGFGQVQTVELHTTTSLSTYNMQLIDRIKTIKHMFALNLPNADTEATHILSLQLPSYMDSWKADLGLILLNSLLEKGMDSSDALEKLGTIADLNPYKAGVLKTCSKLAQTVESERLSGIRMVLEENMKKLQISAASSASEFLSKAKLCFDNKDLKSGLAFLRLGWWIDNIAEPKIIPHATIDGKEVPLSKLRPFEFVNLGLVSVWVNRESMVPKGFDCIFSEDVDLYSPSHHGYTPIELSDVEGTHIPHPSSFSIMLLKPQHETQNLHAIAGIYRTDKGANALLNSIGIPYPYLTNVDRFSIKSYELLSAKK